MTDELQDPHYRRLRRKCDARGIVIMRRGRARLFEGRGVRLLVDDLRYVTDADLRPLREYARRNEA